MRNPKTKKQQSNRAQLSRVKAQSPAQRRHRKKMARKSYGSFQVEHSVPSMEFLQGRASNREARVPCSRCHPNWMASRVARTGGVWRYLCCGATEPQPELDPAA